MHLNASMMNIANPDNRPAGAVRVRSIF